MDYEKYYGKIIKVGDSIGITIPTRLCKFSGFELGDNVVVMIKKNI